MTAGKSDTANSVPFPLIQVAARLDKTKTELLQARTSMTEADTAALLQEVVALGSLSTLQWLRDQNWPHFSTCLLAAIVQHSPLTAFLELWDFGVVHDDSTCLKQLKLYLTRPLCCQTVVAQFKDKGVSTSSFVAELLQADTADCLWHNTVDAFVEVYQPTAEEVGPLLSRVTGRSVLRQIMLTSFPAIQKELDVEIALQYTKADLGTAFEDMRLTLLDWLLYRFGQPDDIAPLVDGGALSLTECTEVLLRHGLLQSLSTLDDKGLAAVIRTASVWVLELLHSKGLLPMQQLQRYISQTPGSLRETYSQQSGHWLQRTFFPQHVSDFLGTRMSHCWDLRLSFYYDTACVAAIQEDNMDILTWLENECSHYTGFRNQIRMDTAVQACFEADTAANCVRLLDHVLAYFNRRHRAFIELRDCFLTHLSTVKSKEVLKWLHKNCALSSLDFDKVDSIQLPVRCVLKFYDRGVITGVQLQQWSANYFPALSPEDRQLYLNTKLPLSKAAVLQDKADLLLQLVLTEGQDEWNRCKELVQAHQLTNRDMHFHRIWKKVCRTGKVKMLKLLKDHFRPCPSYTFVTSAALLPMEVQVFLYKKCGSADMLELIHSLSPPCLKEKPLLSWTLEDAERCFVHLCEGVSSDSRLAVCQWWMLTFGKRVGRSFIVEQKSKASVHLRKNCLDLVFPIEDEAEARAFLHQYLQSKLETSMAYMASSAQFRKVMDDTLASLSS